MKLICHGPGDYQTADLRYKLFRGVWGEWIAYPEPWMEHEAIAEAATLRELRAKVEEYDQ